MVVLDANGGNGTDDLSRDGNAICTTKINTVVSNHSRKPDSRHLRISSPVDISSTIRSLGDNPILNRSSKEHREIGEREDTLLLSLFISFDLLLSSGIRVELIRPDGPDLPDGATPPSADGSRAMEDGGGLEARGEDDPLVLVVDGMGDLPLIK